MKQLPENWDTLSHTQKSIFFSRYYVNYVREGETNGIYEWAPEEVKNAYEAFLKEESED